MTRRAVALALMALLLPGCASIQGDDPAPPKPAPPTPPMDGIAYNGTFDAALNGWTAVDGDWTASATTPGAATIANDEGHKRLLATIARNHTDFQAAVRLQFTGDAAGFIVHWVDDDNHQLVLAESDGWGYYAVHRGKRDHVETSTVPGATPPVQGQWLDLRITSTDRLLQVFAGEQKVVEHLLPPSHVQTGHLGFDVRGATQATFRGFQVEPLPARSGL